MQKVIAVYSTLAILQKISLMYNFHFENHKRIMEIIENHQVLINALKEVLNGNIISKINKPFMDFKETCSFLGISASCLYKYRMNNIVPYYKTGKKLYFKKEELENWLNVRKVKSNDELTTEIEIHTKRKYSYVR